MNKTPLTTSPGYYTDIHGSPGRLVIKSPRGLVATMEAGYGSAREEDAARIIATVEAFPRVLAALKALVNCPDYRGISTHEMSNARAEIERVEGREA